MTAMWKVFDKNCKSNNIRLRWGNCPRFWLNKEINSLSFTNFTHNFRPNAGNGVWLSGLLLLAFLQTILRNPGTVHLSYDLSTFLLLGTFLQTLEAFFTFAHDGTNFVVALIFKLVPSLVTSSLLHLVLNQEITFSIMTALIVMCVYRFTLIQSMKSLPLSFTFGEASIVTQGLVVFLYNCYLQLPFLDQSKSPYEDLTRVLQVGLLGVCVITLATHFISVFKTCFMFYLLLLAVSAAICIVPIKDKLAVTILINFIFNDIERVAIVAVYIALLSLAGFTVTWQLRKNQRGTTRTRKIFHILTVLVFLPGLIFQCHFLYVASVVILAVFIILELARVIKLYPVAEALDSAVTAFIDEKDAGKLALTPIYLLVGCSIPMWIHNSPCDLTGSSSFELLPLLSGVVSIGIGDTFASFFGSKFGRHKWIDGKKSVEGTIASIIAQAAFIATLNTLGYLPLNTRLFALCGIAVITNSLVEALTDQVDNLVLPIVTYIILAFK